MSCAHLKFRGAFLQPSPLAFSMRCAVTELLLLSPSIGCLLRVQMFEMDAHVGVEVLGLLLMKVQNLILCSMHYIISGQRHGHSSTSDLLPQHQN